MWHPTTRPTIVALPLRSCSFRLRRTLDCACVNLPPTLAPASINLPPLSVIARPQRPSLEFCLFVEKLPVCPFRSNLRLPHRFDAFARRWDWMQTRRPGSGWDLRRFANVTAHLGYDVEAACYSILRRLRCSKELLGEWQRLRAGGSSGEAGGPAAEGGAAADWADAAGHRDWG